MSDSKPMSITVPGKQSQKFNPNLLTPGTPIFYKYDVNDHYFAALIQEYGPYFITMTNGTIHRTIEVPEILEDHCEIVSLSQDPDDPQTMVIECTVFDVSRIPVGSIYIDQDGMSFMVIAVDPFYLELRDHLGKAFHVQAEVFFHLDKEEQENCQLIMPPLYVDRMVEEAKAYKERL